MIKHILTITAPSCSGKSTTANILATKYGYGQVISTTTRQPRVGEVEGVDYNFIGFDEFSLRKDQFIEQLTYDGNLYGVASSEITRLSEGGFENVVIVAEPNGVHQISKWSVANGINFTPVYLDVDQVVCYRRLLERFVTDSGNNRFQRYSNRLSTMNSEFNWLNVWKSIDWVVIPVEPYFTPETVAVSVHNLLKGNNHGL